MRFAGASRAGWTPGERARSGRSPAGCARGLLLHTLSAVASCPRCGEDNPDRAKFCLNCGASFEADAASSQERKLVSVLFVDLVGFTERSDQADPEDVRESLEAYHALSKEQVERFGGGLEKVIGRARLARFVAPVAHG